MQLKQWLSSLLCLPPLTWSVEVLAHGAQINYKQTQGIEITAIYEQGQPMTNAQVVIYSPEDPATPWLTGTTNEQGRFSFIPDSNQQGNWDVKVRESGHGALISIPIGNESNINTAPTPPQSGYTSQQKMLMTASGIWGFVGTALFFSRQPKN